jgi:hypothetical protein
MPTIDSVPATNVATTSSKIAVTFESERMTNSTELKRLLRALDTLYYAMLFSGEPEYEQRPEVWHGWVRLGFATGLQEGPSGAEPADRIRVHTFSNSKELTFTVHDGRVATLERWVRVLKEIDRVRLATAEPDGGQRARQLRLNDLVRREVVEPVAAATKACATEDAERIERAVDTALATLTYPIVRACRVVQGV